MNVIETFDPLSKKYLRIFFIVILLVIAIFLRVYKISSIPPALEQDETAIGYNAYSILETGKDEWGVAHPLYFKSFGDQKLPVYIYTVAIFEKFLGVNEYAVRLPSAIAGILAVIIIFALTRHLTKNFTLSFMTAFLLSINPQHLHFSRAAFEVNVALTAALAGVYLFIVAVDKKKLLLLFISVLAFSISLYSYNVTRLLSPLLLLGLTCIYWKKIKEFKPSELSMVALFFFITLLPFIISFFSASGILSAKSSLITSPEILAKDVEMRSYLISLPAIFLKIFYNQYVYIVFQYFQNLAGILSGTFFFISGTSHPHQGIGTVGMFYLFDLPFFIAGLVTFYSKKIKGYTIFSFWLLASYFTLALSKEVPHTTRGYFMILPVVVFSALGLFSFIHYVSHLPNKIIKLAIFSFTSIFILYNIQFYLTSYYLRFPVEYASRWQLGNKELSAYLKDVDYKYRKIIIDDRADFIYTTLLFYNKYPPAQFMKTVTWGNKGLLQTAKSWGKYEFRQINWEKDKNLNNTLLITNADGWPTNLPIHTYLYYPTRPVVISVNDTIAQYPKTDIAYMMVDTNRLPKKKIVVK